MKNKTDTPTSQPSAAGEAAPLHIQHPNLNAVELDSLGFISETLRNADSKTAPARHLSAMALGLTGYVTLDEQRNAHAGLVDDLAAEQKAHAETARKLLRAEDEAWQAGRTIARLEMEKAGLVEALERAKAIRNPSVRWTKEETARSWAAWDEQARAALAAAKQP